MRLQRFKEWTKENLAVLSAIAISVADIKTTITMDTRKAFVGGTRATGKFAKALYNIVKKFGSLLGTLLTVIAQIISFGTKGLE